MLVMPRRRPWTIVVAVISFVIVVVVIVVTKTNPGVECPKTPATQQDFDEALAIGEGKFEPEWELKYADDGGLISVGWFNHQTGALVHSQYLLYNCGYTQADVDRFYSEDGLKVMMGGYKSWTQTAKCEKNGISLMEFEMDYDGTPYKSRFWHMIVNDKRVQDVRLDFAATDQAAMDDYAARFFADFTNCPE